MPSKTLPHSELPLEVISYNPSHMIQSKGKSY